MNLRPLRIVCGATLLAYFLFFCSFLPAYAAPQADTISVVSQKATPHFPKDIVFSATISTTQGQIKDVSLVITLGISDPLARPVILTQQGSTVSVEYTFNTTGSYYVAPGGQIGYSWTIQSTTGTTYKSPAQTFANDDKQHNWQRKEEGKLQMNWYNQAGNFGQVAFDKAKAALPLISNRIGADLKNPIKIWIYKTRDDYHASMGEDDLDWSGGVAFSEYNVTSFYAETVTDENLDVTMPHEMTHLVFHQVTNDEDTPHWFDEGLAEYNTYPTGNVPMLYNFKKAVDKNELLPLSQFSSRYPTDVDKVSLGYAESTKLMEYMYKTFGLPKMHDLIKAIADPKERFDKDLQTVLGLDTAHLENNWHVSLGLPPTLSALELTPTPVPTKVPPTPISTPVAPVNDNANVVIVGILLVGVPVAGIGGLLIFVMMVRKRERERTLAVQQAEQILAMSFQRPAAPPYPPYLQQQPYPQQPNQHYGYGSFGAPPPTTPYPTAAPQPYEYGAFGAPTPPPVVPQTPVQNGMVQPVPPMPRAQNGAAQPVPQVPMQNEPPIRESTKTLESLEAPKETGAAQE